MYEVTRLFIGGILEGLTHTEITRHEFTVGFECLNPCGGGSPYRIIAVRKIS